MPQIPSTTKLPNMPISQQQNELLNGEMKNGSAAAAVLSDSKIKTLSQTSEKIPITIQNNNNKLIKNATIDDIRKQRELH